MPDLTPITREEKYLSAAAGNDVDLPEPITREEHFLLAVAQSGGGGGGGGTTDYTDLSNKPAINGNTLSGNKTTAELGISIPSKTSDLTNDAEFQTRTQVDSSINAKLSSTYKAGGSRLFANLPALTEANLGLVVNVEDDFTTTSDFLEGEGNTYPAGTNVVIAVNGLSYKYDVLAGFIDMSYFYRTLDVLSRIGFMREASGNPAEFTTDIAAPLLSLSVDIEPVQSGSGDPSPTNVRPITGWTAATVTRTAGTDTAAITVSFGSAGTVYGGMLDVLNGKLTVTHKRWDLGSLTWNTWNGFFWSTLDGRLANPEDFLNASNSNILKRGVANVNQNLPDWSFDPFSYNDPQCYVALPGITSTSAAKTWLQNNGAYIAGPLATPIAYTLTPAQLSTLAGTNVVYADCGAVNLSFQSTIGPLINS